MTKKYELLEDQSIEWNGHTLYRIRALKSFGDVKEGDIGGWIECEENLSHEGNCWLFDDAKAYENGRVRENAQMWNNSSIFNYANLSENCNLYGYSKVSGYVCIFGAVIIGGRADIRGKVRISGRLIFGGNSIIENYSDYINMPVRWNNTTLTKDHIQCGCFSGTPAEFEIAVIVKYGETYGCYADVINVLKIKGWLK